MQGTGGARTNPIVAGDDMFLDGGFTTEFIDSDEGSPLPHIEYGRNPDTLQSLDSTRAAEYKSLIPTTPDLTVSPNGATSSSVKGSQDSSSSSLWSKARSSLASTKTTVTEGDVEMGDNNVGKPEWRFEDFVHEDSCAQPEDGTVDPSSIENQAYFTDNYGTSSSPEILGPSNTFYPFGTAVVDTFFPLEDHAGCGNGNSISSPDGPDHARRRSQGHGVKSLPAWVSTVVERPLTTQQQHSLNQTMGRLTTKGSREVSPLSNPLPTGGSSPPSGFKLSPSPNAPPMDFPDSASAGAQLANLAWPNSFAAVHPNPAQQSSAPRTQRQIPATMRPSLPAPLPIQHAHDSAPFELKIDDTPLKSRVETQIRIRMTLSRLPQGVTHVHLPPHTISKPKLRAKPPPQPSPAMLELHTHLVCTSAMQDSTVRTAARQRAIVKARAAAARLSSPGDTTGNVEKLKPQNGGEVYICSGCMTREEKRASRKKIKKLEDEQLWKRDEARRVVVFNTQEVKEWQISVDKNNPGFYVEAPMRIACYCRHHSEKLGFQVIFTVTDFEGNYVAQTMSNSIMITDDHKAQPFLYPNPTGDAVNNLEAELIPGSTNLAQDANSSSSPESTFYLPHSSSDTQLPKSNHPVKFQSSAAATSSSQAAAAAGHQRNLSRPGSPTGASRPSCKKRKASGSVKVPSGLAMTRLDTAPTPPAQPPNQSTPPVSLSTSTSPFSPNISSFSPAVEPPLFTNTQQTNNPFPVGQPATNIADTLAFPNGNRSGGLDNPRAPAAHGHMSSAPASSHPSRVPSPSELNGGQVAQALPSSLYNLAVNTTLSRPPPTIHKIIPAEGPTTGGVEVTILGCGFYQGLEVKFGENKATTTTFWGENSLVCLLPPSAHEGPVLVTLTHQNGSPLPSTGRAVFFKYYRDEPALMRSALAFLGHRFLGQLDDPTGIARSILHGNLNGFSGWGGSNGPGPGGQPPFSSLNVNLEVALLNVLEVVDRVGGVHKPRLNLRRSTGQTMLHLACALGLRKFVSALLARGANVDLRDKGGYTPLHLASLNGYTEIARCLISYGADPTTRTLSGLTAADLAQSREVIQVIRSPEGQAGSYSSTAPPPAYDEIYPRGDFETKQASAAHAAAEAEADHKCAVLYDQPNAAAVAAATASSSAVETRRKLPATLQIGRKNAITKEQQEDLRRVHAEKLKRLSRDRNLFFIWIPLLAVTICAMLYNSFPGLFGAAWGSLPTLNKQVIEEVA